MTLGGSSVPMAQFLKGTDLSDIEKVTRELEPGMAVLGRLQGQGGAKAGVLDFHIELA